MLSFFDTIVVAAGSSQRLGSDKLLTVLADKPLLAHTVQRFCDYQQCRRIIVVCPEQRWQQVEGYVDVKDTVIIRIDGGKERHFSVANALHYLTANQVEDFIAVHDGARPIITSDAISKVWQQAQISGAATLAHRVVETLKKRRDDNSLTAVTRDNLWAMQTPQIYKSCLLFKAYQAILAQELLVTDEVSALNTIGINTDLVEHSNQNMKVTYLADLVQAEFLINHLKL